MSKVSMNAKPGMHDVVMTREFDAPRELVFRAFTDPTLIPQWWGVSSQTIIDQLDAQRGGVWRFVQREENGAEYAFHGVFHEVVAPERIVQTFEFEGMPGHVMLETMTFEERDGKTFLTDTSVFQSVQARDGMVASGMEEGTNVGFEKLDAILTTLR
jgi:uncharacterized protein YndB with AHSA1/START domain